MDSSEAAADTALKQATEWTVGETNAFMYGYMKACGQNPDFTAGLVAGIGLCTTLYCVCKWKSFLLGTLFGVFIAS